jgi:diaminopimelate epimerase
LSIKYEIYSGAGNDFVMIDNINGKIPADKQKDFTIDVCNKQFQQIDGVIFADKPLMKNSALRMNYYNRDGSFGAMCGNGARCISMFAYKNGLLKERKFILEAVDDLYNSEIIDDLNVKISFPEPKEVKLNILIKVEFGEGLKDMNVSYVNVGSDHIVIFLDEEMNRDALDLKSIDELDINYTGKILRFHNEFQPRGANVNFVVPVNTNEIRIRTYERGVERETLACGTGIVASSIVSALSGKTKTPVRVLVQSGEWLTVDFKLQNERISNLNLTGSARKISEGDIE